MQHLEFLFQQRLCLFNTRREHEWKIFFGVIFLLGAVDYALLNTPALHAQAKIWWPFCSLVLLLTSIYYQLGVQKRNHADRLVMDAICEEISTEIPVSDAMHRNFIKWHIDCSSQQETYPDVYHTTYLWAFYCEMIVLFIACLISAALPYVLSHGLSVLDLAAR